MIGLAAKSVHYSADDDLPRLLILSHKSDTLGGTSSTAAGNSSTIDEKTASLSLERTRTALSKEMSKLKSARTTMGGKIEGMSAVPASADGAGMGLLGRLFGRQQGATASDDQESPDGTSIHDLEAAEAMVWGSGAQHQTFEWSQVDGIQVEWAASALPGLKAVASGRSAGADEAANGLEALRDWLDQAHD